MRGFALRLLLCAVMIVGAGACSKNSSSPPTQPVSVDTTILYAVPPWVAVGNGGIQHVNVSGGNPPYSIASGPASIAAVEIADADSAVAVLKITGATASAETTAVTVRDNTRSSPKTVSISIYTF
jgi:hypothetical protein